MKNHAASFGLMEARLLSRTAGIPLMELLGEKPKTLDELRSQIGALPEQQHSQDELREQMRNADPVTLETMGRNLATLEGRKEIVAALLERQDLRSVIDTVRQSSAPVSAPAAESSVEDATTSYVPEVIRKAGNDFMQGGILTKLQYGAGAVAGFLGLRYLWRKVFGDQEKEGWLKKTGKWLLSGLAAVAGVVGIANVREWWNKTASSPWSFFTSMFSSDKSDPSTSEPSTISTILNSPATVANAGRDITQGGLESVKDMIVQPISGATEIAGALLDGNVSEAVSIAADKGWNLFVSPDGNIVVQDTLLKPITAPIRATWKLMTAEGRNSEDFWFVWGEAGAAYLIARKSLEAWKTGRIPIPLSMKEVVADAMRVASGPVQSWVDGARTILLSTEKDGLRALRLRYGSQSYLGRKLLAGQNSIFSQTVRSESGALRLLSRYQRLSEDLRIMRSFSDGGRSVNFTKEEIAAMEKLINNTVDSVKKYVETADNLQSPFLRTLKGRIGGMASEMDEVRKKVAELFAEFQSKPVTASSLPAASTAEDMVSAVDDAARSAGVLDDVVDDSADILKFPGARTAPNPTPGLRRAVGDGVTEPVADALEETAPAARTTAPGLRVFNPDDAVDVVAGARLAELAQANPKIAQALEGLTVHPNFARLLDESEPFANLFARQLAASDDPAKLLTGFNNLAGKLDDPLVITKVITTESRFAKAVSVMDKGGDVVFAFSKTAKVLKVLQAAGMVADAFTIYTTICEMIETKGLIDALDKRGGNPQLRSLYMQRYAFHAAQLGVAGTGLVTGGLALAGIGGSVAGPVALATLPVSALLYGAYQGHQWNEAKTRTVKDWSAEYDTPTLIADLRSYETMTEGVGHVWDAGFDDWRWLWMLNPVTSVYQAVHDTASGETLNQIRQVTADMKSVNEKKIRAIVEQTTMVTVPEQVMGEDGNPRGLTEEEVGYYRTAAQAYVDGKVAFIMNKVRSDYTPIDSGEDVLELMRGAENYGQFKYSEALLTAQGQPLPENWPKNTSIEDTSRQYGEFRQRQTMEGLYSRYLLQSALADQGEDVITPEFERDVGQYLLQETQPVIVRFMVECQEENFKDWWPDGDALQVLRAYLMQGLTPLLRSESARIVQGTLADIARDTAETTTETYRQHPVDALQQRVRDAQAKIKDHFLSRRPRQLWESISDTEKAKFASIVGIPPSQYFPEFRGKDSIGETPKDAVPIELLISQSQGKTPARGNCVYVTGAKDYTLIPIREGTVVYSVFETERIKISTNEPFRIDLGLYQVYRPGETPPADYRQSTTPSLSVIRERTPEQEAEWTALKARRFQEGSRVLQEGKATVLPGHANTFVMRLSAFDRGVEFYFNADTGTWLAGIGAVVPDDVTRWKSAMGGRDPSTFRVAGMAWGNSEAYNTVIERLESVNALTR